MTIKGWSLVNSLYSHDTILVLFSWIIKKDYKKLVTVFSHWRLEPVNSQAGICRLYNFASTSMQRHGNDETLSQRVVPAGRTSGMV